MIPELLFWMSLLALLHSYIFFPLILKVLSFRKKENQLVYTTDEPLPFVSVIMAVHNEETVLIEKLKSIYYSYYPHQSIEVLVGSDASKDSTNRILNVYEGNYESFTHKEFKIRIGKPEIINRLVPLAKGDILIVTDANIFLRPSTIFEIVKHFKNPDIGLVDTKMVHRGEKITGISYQENAYIKREFNIKEMESKIWGTMMGPFGGCFALRKNLFSPIPKKFLVDDFFLNMIVLTEKYKAITSSTALVTEDVSINLTEEFRRKVRIAAGNFQNLSRFFKLLWPPCKPTGFCFLSHKVLRWIGPFFMIIMLITCILLRKNVFYYYLFITQIAIFLIPLADFLLQKIRINSRFLRFITHFLSMNLALFTGFFRYVTGIKNNIWQPTRRNQSE